MKWIPYMLVVLLLAAPNPARAGFPVFRLDHDRIWLDVQELPVTELLGLFSAAGVAVQVDPSVHKTVAGRYDNADVERVLAALLAPYSFVLEWRREKGPLGELTRLTGIRVFREGRAAAVEPLRVARRVQTTPDGRARYAAREILVGFAPGATVEHLKALLAQMGGTLIAVDADLGLYRILLPEGANVPELAAQLARDPNLAAAEPNWIYDLPEMRQSGGDGNGTTAWQLSSAAAPVAVAVLDSGVAIDPALNGALLSVFNALDPSAVGAVDTLGHGTLMAKLASGLIDPFGTGEVRGVPVVAVKAFADDGMTDTFTLVEAVSHALKNSNGPISLSWGTEEPSRFLQAAIDRALSEGRPVLAAVGNENTGRPFYPAAFPGVLGVAASGPDGQLADYSNRGEFVDLIAPGTAGGASGTSVATAVAANLLAQVMQEKGVDGAEAIRILRNAAGPSGTIDAATLRKLR